MEQKHSALDEQELKERIKMLIAEEKIIRGERHRLEARLRRIIMERYTDLYRRYSGKEKDLKVPS
ncbi:MAG: hypothetical protein NWE89_08505 [Candidatus Bathyarchaeota archaeon]|nr:hypothetical protein [Candidatus Bathyarchaeota archaeon]